MAPPDDVGLAERKRALRLQQRTIRQAIGLETHAAASRSAALHALTELPWRERPKVALFWPLADEIDTRPLLHALHWLGGEPLLPRMAGRGRPLTFHPWRPDLALVEGRFRVWEPPASSPAVKPDIVLAPLLAFDRAGHRLGYGAGFYDTTFASLGNVLRAGLCFACQEVDRVPADATDVPLHAVVTERGLHTLTPVGS